MKQSTIYIGTFVAAAVFALAGCITKTNQTPNVLTEAEKSEGWELLFDGKNIPSDKWVGVKTGLSSFPAKGWTVEDGCLTVHPEKAIVDGKTVPLPENIRALGGGGDIVTKAKYSDFEFAFDFRLTKAGNSGVKYFYDEKLDKGTCEEYQILDNAHPDSKKGRDGNRKAASLYDLIPANADSILRPLGEWNSGRVVSCGKKVEHWLNGVKVLEYERGSAAFRDVVNASKYAKWGVGPDGKARPWGENAQGRVLLQDHTDSTVSFRNLKVKSWNCR